MTDYGFDEAKRAEVAEHANEIDVIKDSLARADEMNLPESVRRQYEAILVDRQIRADNHEYAEMLNIPADAKKMCETLRNEVQLNHAKNCDVVIRKWGKEFKARLNIEKFLARAVYGQNLAELLDDKQFSQAQSQAVEKLGGWKHFYDPSMMVTLDDVYAVTMPRGGRCVYVNDDAGKAAEETRGVSVAQPEERVADISAFNTRYCETYNRLYDSREAVPGYREAIDAGDKMFKTHPDLLGDFCKYRIDVITSDRELAAFALTLKSMGLVKDLENYDRDLDKVRWSMSHVEIVDRMNKTIEARNAAYQKAKEQKKKGHGRGM